MPTRSAREGGRRPPARSDTPPALASHRVHRRGSTLTTTFRDLGIFPETAEALEAVGIITPFPIQEMTLPVALSGSDIIGQAKTGTGKTLGFGLPLLERVVVPADVEAGRAKPEDLVDSPQALVVVPTRELCTQVTNDLLTAGKVRNVRVTAIYGGRAYEPQVEALKKGVDVVIGTPGRLLDLAGQKKLNLKHVKCLVLDEADEMLDLGFLPDVEKIINMLPARRQTMLFSATMPGAVIGLARRYMSQPTHISATSPDDEGATVRNTAQHIYRAHNMDKPEIVSRILQADGRGLVMVFCRTKRTAADLADQLKQRGFASGAVHGDLGQGAREQALRAFRNGKVDVLVCTDVAARGIDVEGVTHVINYQSPEDEKTYLHRIGRTGRAGAKGIAITLVDWDDIPRWQLINKALDLGFNDPPETYSTSPHLFEELSIPVGTKGVLPRSERTRAGLDAEEVEDLGEPGGRGPRGRGGRAAGPSSTERERERPARTPRRRRRTRGGSTVEGTSPEAVAVTEPSESTQTPGSDSVASEPRTPRRRRRTRAGANPAAEAVTETEIETVDSAPVESAEVVVDTVAGAPVESVEEAAPKQRRRRTRKSVEVAATPVAEAAPGANAALDTAEGTTDVEPAAEAVTKPRRRTRKVAAPVEAAPAEAVSEEAAAEETPAPAKPRRRTRKAAESVESAVEATDSAAETAVEAAEAPKPRRRSTRKATATAAESVVEAVAEEAVVEAPAPRRRTRKAAAAAEAPAAEAVVDTAEGTAVAESAAEAVTKPRRRARKVAAPAEAAAAEAVSEEAAAEEAPTKPRRRVRKVAESVESVGEATDSAVVDAAEAPKPRRRTTRKAAATAEGAVPAQPTEEQATKPRRARKAAASVDGGEAGAEAPAPRRRARKAAVAVVEGSEG
ncbi:DEAD/DEAH box helicase [Streptomyces sp. ID-01-6.2a]|uniref:RNA helicase n=2 Tax=Streptomyces caniscabiei TaxID=2746961 RepID=A0A927KYB6_9ACTN|nr:DEAD/DEAH box helicase [Streptomyces caniscabiei]